MEQRVSLITLGVRDLARARAFYEGLGWDHPGGAGRRRRLLPGRRHGRRALGPRRLAEDSGVEDGGGWGGITPAHNVRSPAEVDAVIEEARRAGADIVREPAETFWGGYSAAFTDPEGHPWEVAHNPRWAIADDGSIRSRSCPLRLHRAGDASDGPTPGRRSVRTVLLRCDLKT